MPDLTIPQEAVEAAGLALGKALAAATYLDRGEEYVDWGEWHPCAECPRPEVGKCGCAGAPFAKADLTSPTLAAAAPHIAAALRSAAEELQARMNQSACGLVYSAWLRYRADTFDGRQPSQDTREGILAAAGLTEEDMAGKVRVVEEFRLESYGPDPHGMGAVIRVVREQGVSRSNPGRIPGEGEQ